MSLEQHHYADGDTALTGLLARPAGTPRAAVLVFPTIMNPTPAVETKAKALAEAGYLALIADFYGQRPADFDEARALAAAIRPDPLAYRRRLKAGLRALATLPEAARPAARRDRLLHGRPGRARAGPRRRAARSP